jgi:3-hydroxyacyl-CoA dehydrogenase/3-hydroxy-2-methylbutyryl-CoA dehydrogenase
MQLSQAKAMVTGGASGLGGATVARIHAAGGSVAILDLPTSQGEEVAATLGERAIFCPTDVTSEADVQKAVDGAVAAFGGVNVLVNCAGIGMAGRTISRTGPFPLDVFAKTIEINLIGTFNCIRLATFQMSRNEPGESGERGVVVNTASVAAFDGQIGQAAYSASKGGVVGMTLPIARDLSSVGIRVMTIAPGTFDTPMLGLAPQEMRDALAAQIPFPKRLGDPKEFAALACHIVENQMLNGETIRLDGAIRMAPK